MCGPISNQLVVPRVQFEYDHRQCLHFWQTVGIKMSVPLNYPPITSLTPQYYLLCHCLLSSRDSFIMVKKNWFYMYRNTISTYQTLTHHPSSARIQRFQTYNLIIAVKGLVLTNDLTKQYGWLMGSRRWSGRHPGDMVSQPLRVKPLSLLAPLFFFLTILKRWYCSSFLLWEAFLEKNTFFGHCPNA